MAKWTLLINFCLRLIRFNTLILYRQSQFKTPQSVTIDANLSDQIIHKADVFIYIMFRTSNLTSRRTFANSTCQRDKTTELSTQIYECISMWYNEEKLPGRK